MIYTTQNQLSDFSVLTPYIIPPQLSGKKVVNLGDGFILRAIERLLGRFASDKVFTPRAPLPTSAISLLESSRAVILAGANQLNDHYTVWPGLTLENLQSSHLRLIPFGVGIHGEKGHSESLSDITKDLLREIHRRIEYSSWRCPNTVAFLKNQLPELSPQILMTGCPVVYDKPLLEAQKFNAKTKHIAVTVTERHDFWDRETSVIDFVAKNFPNAELYLVLHQNYSKPRLMENFSHKWLPESISVKNQYQRLRRYAVRKQFKIISPPDVDSCLKFYNQIDMHIGSRLHAHLLFLSRAKRSWLIPVDGRSEGMAEFFGFPLCSAYEMDRFLDFDFDIVTQSAQIGFVEMSRFTKSLLK